jgi:hypothetical protein
VLNWVNRAKIVRQFICQLRLTSENDLHKFHPRDLKVGKHPHRFQDSVLQVLRFIYHDYDAPARVRFADQKFIQFAVHWAELTVPVTDAQVGQKRAQEVAGVTVLLEQEGGAGRISQALQEMKEKSGFAHSRLCNQSEKPSLALNPIKQGCQCFEVRGTEIEKMGIGRNPEGLLAQTEVIQEHGFSLLTISWYGNHQRNVQVLLNFVGCSKRRVKMLAEETYS